ncbi:hypothetical protein K491DRAFT_649860 [Lophiostoma macrostomum CBS 122681]|uniref:MYND-type domain-containing protein n=1 Tax=Lophiostoma macrostomum CBS 122681 TaxID=1314788 RepID=A0A6A6TMX3_9PLEO|nr:hypothetical protein K491DRAFT_649860 [Lophiostoma macrostomum CBS 122681]
MDEAAHTTCSHCGKQASNKCLGCNNHVYCGKECQKKDWPTHKMLCKDIRLDRAVFRIANLLQKMFLVFGRHSCETVYGSVEQNGNTIILNETYKARTRAGFFDSFPHCQMTEELEAIALCACSCDVSLWALHPFIANMLSVLGLKVEELNIRLSHCPRQVVINLTDGTSENNSLGRDHSVFLWTSRKRNRSWIIDLTGVQYGIDIYHRAEDYSKKFVKSIVHKKEFGRYKRYAEEVAKLCIYEGLYCKICLHLSEQIMQAVQAWTEMSAIPLSTLTHLDQDEFVTHRDALLTYIDTTLRNFMDKADYSAELAAVSAWENANPGLHELLTHQVRAKILGPG